MPDLLLELFSEEIPARMQAKAADDLRRMVTDKLVAEGLVYEGAKAFATPRRLALTVHGVPVRQPDLKDERKGPKVGAPDAAVQGFLKAAGLTSLDEAKIQRDPKKGDFYVALIEKPGRPAIDVIAEILPVIVRTFPWPKQMRWGERSSKPGALTWVRPLHSIVATFGMETEEPDVVAFDVAGIAAGQVTRGHRFMAPDEFSVRRFEDYEAKLHAAKVVLDPQRRKDIILADAKDLAFAQGFDLVEDQVLLDEVAGLVEWPVVLMGSFDEEFLSIPNEVIRATIRNNQKCFVVNDPKTGKLANKFILVANIEASDDGKAIVAGNERVIRARLSDAKFFYETDLKTKLEDRLPKFEKIVFHEKLGTQAERITRIERLAAEIAPLVGADVAKAKRAARLCKADLLTEVVGEFPELQGLMGKYYAKAQGEDASVAAACEEHYKPQGPNDRVPSDPVSIAVALADKIDTLVGFWAIDEKPTGSKDPYALRRAALGVIRLVLENQLRFSLKTVIRASVDCAIATESELERLYERSNEAPSSFIDFDHPEKTEEILRPYLKRKGLVSKFFCFFNLDNAHLSAGDYRPSIVDMFYDFHEAYLLLNSRLDELTRDEVKYGASKEGLVDRYEREHSSRHSRYELNSLLSFFADRLKVQLREQGARHDLVDAVFAAGELPPPLRGRVGEGGEPQLQPSALPPPPTPPRKGEGSPAVPAASQQDDLLMIVRRVEALGKFLDTDDGTNLLAGTKRASNILAIEEKRDKRSFDGPSESALMIDPIEKHLWGTIQSTVADANLHIEKEDFETAMESLSTLRSAVDAFFDKVKVNDDDPTIRENRLKLLNEIRAATRTVADFSRIQD